MSNICDQQKRTSSASGSRPSKTIPVEFSLQTQKRSRPVSVQSAVEKENIEVEQMKKQQFRAMPFNKKVISGGGMLGVKRLGKPQPTIPKSPQVLHRPKSKVSFVEDDKSAETVKTTKLNPKLFQEPLGVPEKRIASPTLPEPFFLRTEHIMKQIEIDMMNKQKEKEEEEKKKREFKARSMPDYKIMEVKKAETKIDFHEFNLATQLRGRMYEDKLAQEVEQARKKEEEARQFKAAPAKLTDESLGTPRHKTPTTTIQPFTLVGDKIRMQEEEQSKKKKEEEEEAMKKAREFRAAPAKVLNQAPFIIAPIMRQSINQCPPILASDVRASERKAFNEKLAEQEREKEKLQQLEEEQRKKEEAVEVELMRKDMVFHAQPIMQGSTTPPHPFSGSVLPLTKPQSPKLQTKMRADLTSRGSNGSQMEYKNSAQNQIQVHFADLSKFLKNPEDDEPVVTNDEVEIKIELIGSNDVTEAKIE